MEWKKADLGSAGFETLRSVEVDPLIENLYISGELPDIGNSIAVVGSRKVSEYGRRVCRDFVSVLAKSEITIVSGLMYGIDAEAHNIAIDAGGYTVGVLGYGSDHLYKYGYADRIYKKILELKSGAVVSEYEPNMGASKWSFPKRNRIISALSKAVLVIEGGEHSGSLITAGYALDQGKEVFAVPGSIYNENSKGTNWLIKQGAHMASSVDDILLYFDKVTPSKPAGRKELESSEIELLGVVESYGSATSDQLQTALRLPISDLSARLSKLEILGYISKDISGRFSVLK